MLRTFQNVAQALRDGLVRDSDGRPVVAARPARLMVEDTDGKPAEHG